MYTAIEVADYIVLKCIDDGRPIDCLTLQKLLLCLQCHYIEEFGGRLFKDDFEHHIPYPLVAEPFEKYRCYFGGDISFITRLNKLNPRIKEADREEIDPIIEELSLCSFSALYNKVDELLLKWGESICGSF